MRRALVFVLILLAAAQLVNAASGYLVFLKNGTHIRAREALVIDGRNAMITLPTGTVASYPVDQIDLVRTERYNQLGLGNAYIVLDEESLEPKPTITPTPSLGGLATLNLDSNSVLGSSAPPPPTPTPGIRLQTRPYHDQRVDKAFSQVLDDRKLYTYRTSAGTQPEYFFVQAVTDDQRAVFQAVKAVTEAYAIIHELHPDVSPTAVELEMLSTSGKPAGTFRITPEMARSLASGEMSVEQFYVGYVIF